MKSIYKIIGSMFIVGILFLGTGYSVSAQETLVSNVSLDVEIKQQLIVLLTQLINQLQDQLDQINEEDVTKNNVTEDEYDPKKTPSYPTNKITRDVYGAKSAEAVSLGDDTIAVFTFDLQVEAFEDSFFINENGSDFAVTLSAGTLISTSIIDGPSSVTSDNSYEISEGDSETFTVQVQVSSSAGVGTAQSVRAILDTLTFYPNSDLSGASSVLNFTSSRYRSAPVTVIDSA
jgi:hypothetical protein